MNESKRAVTAALVLCVSTHLCVGDDARVTAPGSKATTPARHGPAYDKNGALKRPDDFRRWVFVGASLGLSYSDAKTEPGEQMFHNVYLEPHAYEHYVKTGTFPEKTMLAMSVYRADRKSTAPEKLKGAFEGELISLEVAVKDGARFDDGWAYFDFSGGSRSKKTAQAFPTKQCYDCHAKHADDDNVFVQFYPILRRARDQRRSQEK